MTDREKEILKIIKNNPLISQKELAEKVGITRSSAGVHISNLMKKGYIQGKGYIIKDEPYVCVIGTTSIDIMGSPKKKLVPKCSNPGKLKMSFDGVGRNISESLSLMGVSVDLITVLGNDIYGQSIVDNCLKIGVGIKNSLILESEKTSTNISILDNDGNIAAAISTIDIFDRLDAKFIDKKENIIKNANLCIIDAGIPKDTIAHTVEKFKNSTFFLSEISCSNYKKVKDLTAYFHTIKLDRKEAEILSGLKIKTLNDLEKVSNFFIEKGTKNIFINMEDKGVFYSDGRHFSLIPIPEASSLNFDEAGETFIASLAYSYIEGDNIRKACLRAMAASIITLMHKDIINSDLSPKNIDRTIRELNIC